MREILLMKETDKIAQKAAKKEAKAAQKLAKKQHQVIETPAAGDNALTEREISAAEKKVALERWRTWFAAAGVLIALLSLLVLFLQKC